MQNIESNSINLSKEVSIALESIKKDFLNFSWTNLEFYKLWLAQTYYFVNHSARLIALTASHFPDKHIKYSEIFLKYIDEEVHHEKLAKMDLKNMNFDVSQLPELPTTAGLYQSQYYWIQHVSAFSFYGYILALEGFAVHFGAELHLLLEEKFGAKATSFLRVHVKEDENHLEQAMEVLKTVPEEHKSEILANFRQSQKMYLNMLANIETVANKNSRKIAA